MPDKDNFNAVIQPIAIDMGGGKSSVDIHTDRSPTLTTTHYGEPAVVYDARGNGDGTVAPTMTGDHQNRVTDYTGVVVASEPSCYSKLAHGFYKADEVSSGLKARDYKGDTDIVLAVDARNCTENETNGSLQSNSAHSLNGNNVVRVKYIVRRLTPLECERLQGFPDRWTDIGEFTDTKGKRCKTSDASRYKALGNSIALPSWKFILKRLCANYERDATMASLFDGIGGFSLLWEQINGKGSCLWASEIEEFPIAVTSRRFNDE
jgi:DNA (cytosine-5)-methyltransferase 1